MGLKLKSCPNVSEEMHNVLDALVAIFENAKGIQQYYHPRRAGNTTEAHQKEALFQMVNYVDGHRGAVDKLLRLRERQQDGETGERDK